MELGDGTFYFRPQNNVVLEAGSRYKYTVKVNATGLTLEGCTIGSWVDGGGESGEAEDLGYIYDSNTKTYTVYNANGLLAWNKAIQKDESINCTLTADIDLTGREWTRLDTWPGYSGVFNGQGHSITGLNFSAARFGLFLFLNQSGVIKNLQLIDVNLDGSSGGAAGMVDRNHGQIIACSVTGKLTVHSGGIANANYGDIIACWFNGTLKDEAGCGTIVRFNYKNITSCYWGGNAEQGVLRNEGGTVVATKVDGATVKWQTAVDGMNTALTGAEGTPIVFTATGLNPAATATAGTRAPVDGNWEGVQSVAVLMDGTVKAYDVTPTNATLTSTDPHYWTNHKDITVTAWWPYTAGETSPPAVKVKANQSARKDFEGSDLIVADGQTVTYGSPTLRFTHRLHLH